MVPCQGHSSRLRGRAAVLRHEPLAGDHLDPLARGAATSDMDGVPGVSFGGIKPGETFVPLPGAPERHLLGAQPFGRAGAARPVLSAHPRSAAPEPFHYDRDYVVMLSDWSFESPATIISKLKKDAGYYNFQKRTLGDFFRDGQHRLVGNGQGPPELVEDAHGPDRFRRCHRLHLHLSAQRPPLRPTGQACSIPGKRCGCAALLRRHDVFRRAHS